MIGQTISHYTILLRNIGEGEWVSSQSDDTKLDRPVALKFLPSGISASEQDTARFVQEAKFRGAVESSEHLHHPRHRRA